MSLPFSAEQARIWTGGALRGAADTRCDGVSIDTRSLRSGELFVAVQGPQHDAHDHLSAALAAGATALVVRRGTPRPAEAGDALPMLEVDDTTAALGALAAGHRAGFEGPVIAITGSNGKTTTKEMCAAILSVRAPCLKTRGNLNNAYGLPLTLLAREAEHWALVVEIGMNHRGEIAPLARIARPQVGVITNVGTAHIENLGSRREIAQEKGDLLAVLPPAPRGTAVLNADDPLVLAQGGRSRAQRLRFGAAPEAQVRALGIERKGAQGYGFQLQTPAGRRRIQVAGLGEPTVSNALAAAAAALAVGASLAEIEAGLASYQPLQGRMEPIALASGATLVDDSYNANPQSTEVALRALAKLKGEGRGVAVLGDMGELGETARDAHRSAGALAARLGFDRLVALGRFAEELAGGARDAGMEAARIRVASDHDEAADAVQSQLARGDWVLVKGSRSMHMERIVESLIAESKGE